MSATVNARYEIKSNIKEIMEKDYLEKKEKWESVHDNKYFRVDYYDELAMYCGISPSTVSQMKQRNLFPSYIVAIKMSQWLKVDVTEIWEVVEKNK